MSKESLVQMLKTLCKYNTVEIKHTFSLEGQPQITVRCIKNTNKIEITYLDSQTVEIFDDFEEAAQVIELIIK